MTLCNSWILILCLLEFRKLFNKTEELVVTAKSIEKALQTHILLQDQYIMIKYFTCLQHPKIFSPIESLKQFADTVNNDAFSPNPPWTGDEVF